MAVTVCNLLNFKINTAILGQWYTIYYDLNVMNIVKLYSEINEFNILSTHYTATDTKS